MSDKECICEGNWRKIVKENEALIGEIFRDKKGDVYSLFGLVHGGDDYYYGMYSQEHGMRLLSCVGNLESWDFTQFNEIVICDGCKFSFEADATLEPYCIRCRRMREHLRVSGGVPSEGQDK